MKAALATVFASSLATAVIATCQADTCFKSVKLAPVLNKAASAFCLGYVKPTPNLTTTKKCTTTRTTTITPAAPTTTTSTTTLTTVSTTISITVTSGTVCTTTAAVFPTVTNFQARESAIQKRGLEYDAEEEELAKRHLLAVPQNLKAGCSHTGRALTSKISSACSCFLTPTATRSTTVTVTSTKVLPTPNKVTVTVTVTNTVTNTATNTATETPCTSTVTVGGGGATKTCGVPVSAHTSGTVSCPNTIPSPSSNAYFRIEGNDSEGTIFEGCIVAGPRVITTPSGGTHQCDGTNNNANPAPGTPPTVQIDAAGQLTGFGFDGTYSNNFQDFFITSISDSTQTGSQFWGILSNDQFTPTGGCQYLSDQSARTLWAFDAFNKNAFLRVTPDFAAVAPGSTVTTTVTDGQTGNAISGASIFGTTSGANGQVSFTAPTEPGCYLYKATKSDSIRSNTFYLSVF